MAEMKFKFTVQQYQTDAVNSVVRVFAGQPYQDKISYRRDTGTKKIERDIFNYQMSDEELYMGFANAPVALDHNQILRNINEVQRDNNIKEASSLAKHMGACSLDVEMETGTGKTYVYIKTMFELNKQYGWSKFIVIVPSIAIREGVQKSFQTMQDHFMELYGKKARFFVYNSKNLTDIDTFSSNADLSVMIINVQAFNARGKDARRIRMELDDFGSRKPIDVIQANRPIVILDEPQKMGGAKTQESLKEFNPLFVLNYSATHKEHHDLVYVLDALDAYRMKLVKKIEVKGFDIKNLRGTDGYLYLEDIVISPKKPPMARIEFEIGYDKSINRETRIVGVDDDLYALSKEMEQYEGYHINEIDPIKGLVTFTNGVEIHTGEVLGDVSEKDIRRVQIRETIRSHFEKEKELFEQGIKCLSLFFIDKVENYRKYDEDGNEVNSEYGQMFEEEYTSILNEYLTFFNTPYEQYLRSIDVHRTHAGYFSIDKKGHKVDSKLKRGTDISDDEPAYELILKDKEKLLSFDNPVRFIFSHSALREGWDNPNVFQICTLKQSSSEVRKRQEVGRGLRLCVNQNGERMDANVLGNDVHNINILTVIASESYDSFAKGLQSELAEAVANRPRKVDATLFVGKVLTDANGNEQIVDADTAAAIYFDLVQNGYVDRHGALTDKYYADHANHAVQVAEEVADCAASVIDLLDSVYSDKVMLPENARSNNVELKIDPDKLAMPEFKALWNKISPKSVYVVDFDTDELVQKSIRSLNRNLNVSKIYFKVESGEMTEIKSKDSLLDGSAFAKADQHKYDPQTKIHASQSVKYDLIGKLVAETKLTRKAIVQILVGIEKAVFDQFKDNPEEFILKAAALINDEKATAIIQHITYNILDEHYDTDIFTEPTLKGKLGMNVMKVQRHLYDHLIYDSSNERDFAADLDTNRDVAVYVKLPDGFYISTPVGKYNPDWAIAFYEGTVKHIYFVAETKGTLDSMKLNHITPVEQAKIDCARAHFKALNDENVVYDVVSDYQTLLNAVMK